MKQKEQWKKHLTLIGYEVSTNGRVRSYKQRKTGKLLTTAKLLHGGLWRYRKENKTPYRYFLLTNNGKQLFRRAGVLVLETFVGPKPPNKECSHLNSNSLNDHLTNLAWETRKENFARIRRTGKRKGKSANEIKAMVKRVNALLTSEQVKEIKLYLKQGATVPELSKLLNIDSMAIQNIKRGNTFKNIKPYTKKELIQMRALDDIDTHASQQLDTYLFEKESKKKGIKIKKDKSSV